MNQVNLLQLAEQYTQYLSDDQLDQYFQNPVFILSAPRSGSTLLFEQLIKQNHIWSIGNESHIIFSQFPHLRFENEEMDSGSLNEFHADPKTSRLIKSAFLYLLQNNQQQRYIDPALTTKPKSPVFIEKTPRNALNIPFILKMFPQARFIYLYRDPRPTIASIIEAWKHGLQTGRFATYPGLPGWHLPAWCFLLPNGWQKLIGKTLPEIACFQWCESNRIIQSAITQLRTNRFHQVNYQDLTQTPNDAIQNVYDFINPESGHKITTTDQLEFSKTTLTAPNINKWKQYEKEIMDLEKYWTLYQ